MMNKQEITSRLVKIANFLDEANFVDEADVITSVASRVAQYDGGFMPHEDFEFPGDIENGEDEAELLRNYRDDSPVEELPPNLIADQYEDDQELDYDKAMAVINTLMPHFDRLSEEDRHKLEAAQAFVDTHSSVSDSLNMGDFTKALSNGGAEVYDPFADQ